MGQVVGKAGPKALPPHLTKKVQMPMAPDVHTALKIAALRSNGVSVGEYLDTMLRQTLNVEEVSAH